MRDEMIGASKTLLVLMVALLLVVFGWAIGEESIQNKLIENEDSYECTIDSEMVNGYCLTVDEWEKITGK